MADKQLRFSIIIPTLNEEHYIGRLLQTIETQTFRRFEVILVDAQSTDKTITTAKKYAAKLPKLTILTSDKKNVSIQRNKGLEVAVGEYLVFFDADIQVPKTFLRSIDRAITRHGARLITTWLKPDTDMPRDQIMTAVTNIGLQVANFIEMPFAGGFDIIVRKDVFEKNGGFNPKLALSEDHDFVQRCSASGSPMLIVRSPRLIVSLRRFRRYGYFAILKTYAQSWVYMFLKQPITKALVDYPMGGHLYRKDKGEPKDALAELERFLLRYLVRYFRYKTYGQTINRYSSKLKNTAINSLMNLRKLL